MGAAIYLVKHGMNGVISDDVLDDRRSASMQLERRSVPGCVEGWEFGGVISRRP